MIWTLRHLYDNLITIFQCNRIFSKDLITLKTSIYMMICAIFPAAIFCQLVRVSCSHAAVWTGFISWCFSTAVFNIILAAMGWPAAGQPVCTSEGQVKLIMEPPKNETKSDIIFRCNHSENMLEIKTLKEIIICHNHWNKLR